VQVFYNLLNPGLNAYNQNTQEHNMKVEQAEQVQETITMYKHCMLSLKEVEQRLGTIMGGAWSISYILGSFTLVSK